MAIKKINIGQVPNDKKGDKFRDAFSKANDNFSELDTRATAAQNTADAAKAKADAAIPTSEKGQPLGVAVLTQEKGVRHPVQVGLMPIGIASSGGPAASNKRQVVSVGTAVSEAGEATPKRYLIFRWKSAGHTMFRMRLGGYIHGATSILSSELSGYIQSSGGIFNLALLHLGQQRPPVGFFRRGADENCVVVDLQGLQYPAVSIMEAQFAYPGSTDVAMMSFLPESTDTVPDDSIQWAVDAGPDVRYQKLTDARGWGTVNQARPDGDSMETVALTRSELLSTANSTADQPIAAPFQVMGLRRDATHAVHLLFGAGEDRAFFRRRYKGVLQPYKEFAFLESIFPSVRFASYTKATVPAAAGRVGAAVYVTNAAGGAALAVSNGTTWISQITGAEV